MKSLWSFIKSSHSWWKQSITIIILFDQNIKEMFTLGFDCKTIGPFVKASEAIVWPLVKLSSSNSNFMSGGKIFVMPNNSKTPCEGSFFYLCKVIVRTSFQIISSLSLLSLIIGDIRQLRLPNTIQRKEEATRLS